MLGQLRGWLYVADVSVPQRNKQESLVEDWEWVMSASEILCNAHAAKESQQMQEELKTIREAGTSMKMKIDFCLIANTHLDNLEQDSKDELSNGLTGPMISKIVSDTIDRYEIEWLTFIKEHILSHVNTNNAFEYEKNWPEIKPYQKNVIGTIKEMVFPISLMEF